MSNGKESIQSVPRIRHFVGGSLMDNIKQKEFEDVLKPAIEWLQKNGCPHDRIIIEYNGAELVSGEMAFSVKVPD